ncbi:hypothetical protein [Propionivibrio sp.]|uniref:hypothetical protein n=1 Tax=Propionivibrio sp. TaxID=2212460 RepID=UPI0025E02210|nr:hypothetical protein [Propionivibrio sp.]MBK7357308.1 hypothetical protein [Propionivibrio sp.]MBK8401288.1 hypothetical protein [Propionivibrio sp.]MBL0209253.1 hypothetical protein [Propionivibrio sp.]
MERNVNSYGIIERARIERSIALGNLIASGTRKTIVGVSRVADRFLHVLLMSPVNSR